MFSLPLLHCGKNDPWLPPDIGVLRPQLLGPTATYPTICPPPLPPPLPVLAGVGFLVGGAGGGFPPPAGAQQSHMSRRRGAPAAWC